MKSIFKLFTYLIVFVLFLLVFTPKESLYYYAEKQLSKQRIIVSNEEKDENFFGLNIKDAIIYYEGIKLANVNKTVITSYLLYSKVEILNVSLLESLSSQFPSIIDSILLTHSVFEYDKVSIQSVGKFGKADGYIDIINRVLYLNIDASSILKGSYSKFLRGMNQKDGRYVYEYRF